MRADAGSLGDGEDEFEVAALGEVERARVVGGLVADLEDAEGAAGLAGRLAEDLV